jgi:hypothetical protein
MTPDAPALPAKAEEEYIARARLWAAMGQPELIRELVNRAKLDDLPVNALVAISEHLHKVSGAASTAKDAKRDPGFSIHIDLGTASVTLTAPESEPEPDTAPIPAALLPIYPFIERETSPGWQLPPPDDPLTPEQEEEIAQMLAPLEAALKRRQAETAAP